MRVVCRIFGSNATVVASFWPSRAFGISSGLTLSGAVSSEVGSDSDVEGSAAVWSSLGVDSTFFGAFAKLSCELRPCVRLLSALQPLRENHLSANRP
jgi:hypothetical protein